MDTVLTSITCNRCHTQFFSTSNAQTYRCFNCSNPIFPNPRRLSNNDHNIHHSQQQEEEGAAAATAYIDRHRHRHLSLSSQRCSLRNNVFFSNFIEHNKVPSKSSYTSLNSSNSVKPVRPSNTVGRITRKRALLCAVSYYSNTKYKLKGTLNDVKNMKGLLMNHFDYPDDSIRVLTGTKYVFFS